MGTLTGIGFYSLGLLTDIPLTGAARVYPGHGTKIARGLDGYTHWYRSATVLLSLLVYLSLAPQDVMAPELQEVSLYQFILI